MSLKVFMIISSFSPSESRRFLGLRSGCSARKKSCKSCRPPP